MKQQSMKYLVLLVLIGCLGMVGCGGTAVADEGPPYIVDTGIDADSWAFIPAGDFIMGLNEHEVAVDYDYEMMVTHVTNQQFAQFLNEALVAGVIHHKDDSIVGYYPGDEFHAHEHVFEIVAGDWPLIDLANPYLRLNFDGEQFTLKPGYENHPVTLVTWFGAKAYCEFGNGRLPTEIEWEKAARGPEGLAYPWGNDIKRNQANYYNSHDPFEKIAGGLGDTTPVGFYSGMVVEGFETLDAPSPYGLYDMAGNVWQWTADVYEGTHMRYLRGGGKADYAYDLRTWTRNSAGPDYASVNVGFRCVREP